MKIVIFIFVRRGAWPPAWDVLTLVRARGRPLTMIFVFADVRNIVRTRLEEIDFFRKKSENPDFRIDPGESLWIRSGSASVFDHPPSC